MLYINTHNKEDVEYTRVILDTPTLPTYEIKRNKLVIKVILTGEYKIQFDPDQIHNPLIKNISITNIGPNKISANIHLTKDVSIKHFLYGHSLIIDMAPKIQKEEPPSAQPEKSPPPAPPKKTPHKGKMHKLKIPKFPTYEPIHLDKKTQTATFDLIFDTNNAKINLFRFGSFLYLVANKNLNSKNSKIPKAHKKLKHTGAHIWKFFIPNIRDISLQRSANRFTVLLSQHLLSNVTKQPYILHADTTTNTLTVSGVRESEIVKFHDPDIDERFTCSLVPNKAYRSAQEQHFSNFTFLKTIAGFTINSLQTYMHMQQNMNMLEIKGTDTFPLTLSKIPPPSLAEDLKAYTQITKNSAAEDGTNPSQQEGDGSRTFIPFFNPFNKKDPSNYLTYIRSINEELISSTKATKPKQMPKEPHEKDKAHEDKPKPVKTPKGLTTLYTQLGDVYAIKMLFFLAIPEYNKALKHAKQVEQQRFLRAKLAMMHILNNRPKNATKYLFHKDLLNEPAMDPWRALYFIKTQNMQMAERYYKDLYNTIGQVHKEFKNKILFSILNLVYTHSDNIEFLLKLFNPSNLSVIEQANLSYMKAYNLAVNGRILQAIEKFDEIISQPHPNRFTILSEAAKTLHTYNHNLMDKQQTIAKLRPICTRIMDPMLRAKVFKTIIGIYLIRGDFLNSIKLIKLLRVYDPEMIKEERLDEKQRNLFYKIIVSKVLKHPHNYIIFFDRYKAFLPKDNKKQGEIYTQISQAYMALDLTDDCEKLLLFTNNTLKYSTAQLTIQLANTYLADLRFNTAADFLAQITSQHPQIIYLKVLALLSAKRWHQAKVMLKSLPENERYNDLRLILAWESNNFPYAERTLRKMLKRQKGKIDPILLLNLASAVKAQNNYTKLVALKAEFTPLLKDTQYIRLFNYITNIHAYPAFDALSIQKTLESTDILSKAVLDVLK